MAKFEQIAELIDISNDYKRKKDKLRLKYKLKKKSFEDMKKEALKTYIDDAYGSNTWWAKLRGKSESRKIDMQIEELFLDSESATAFNELHEWATAKYKSIQPRILRPAAGQRAAEMTINTQWEEFRLPIHDTYDDLFDLLDEVEMADLNTTKDKDVELLNMLKSNIASVDYIMKTYGQTNQDAIHFISKMTIQYGTWFNIDQIDGDIDQFRSWLNDQILPNKTLKRELYRPPTMF